MFCVKERMSYTHISRQGHIFYRTFSTPGRPKNFRLKLIFGNRMAYISESI